MQRKVLSLALICAAVCQPAAAQEICVECDGPVAMYRCALPDLERSPQFRGSGRAIEYLCITEMARQGKHQRCRVARDFGNVCLGDQKAVSLSNLSATPPPDSGSVDPAAPLKAPAGQTADGAPKTLAEVARITVEESKKTAKSAGEQIENAGSAVGGAVKKTWGCLLSFFSAC